MKRLIFQVGVGPRRNLWERCIKSVAQYAASHGIEHRVLREPILRIVPKASQRSKEAVARLGYLPIYEKQNALGLLGEYDQIAVIDSDVYARPGAPNIFEEVPPECDFAAVTERSMPITEAYARKLAKYEPQQYGPLKGVGLPFFQMGIVVMNKSLRRLCPESPKDFVQRPEFERFVNGEGAWRWQTEQTLFNWWLRSSAANVVALPWTWHGLYGAVKPGTIEHCAFVHFFLSDHLTSDDPVDMLRTGNARPRV